MVNSWCLRNELKLACDVIMHGSIFCHCHCSTSGSLIIGAQIAHIDDGEGKLALFSTKGNVLLTPIPSYFSTINLLFLFYFYCYFPSTMSIPHRPYIDPTSTISTLHRPHIEPPSTSHSTFMSTQLR